MDVQVRCRDLEGDVGGSGGMGDKERGCGHSSGM